nr:hypothetical protein [Kofleriaceae bacterium]
MLLVAISAIAAACGGSSEEKPPGPLANHFDDMYIAQVPLDQKQDVVKTQNDWSIAKMEQAKAEADYNDSAAALEVAKNDAKSAHTTLDSAMTMKGTAEKSGDMNRTNQATKDERVAEDEAKAADEHVHYFEHYREFLKAYWRLTQETMYWREAQYELAKSQVAQKGGKAIANVKYEWFPNQEADRARRAAHWKDKTTQSKHDAEGARQKWLDMQKTADVESGHPQNYSTPDPMGAPAQASGQ